MYRILLVDDEESILKALRRLLAMTPVSCGGITYKLQVDSFTSPVEALERCRETAYAAILSDFRMPHMNGVAFLREVRALQPHAVRLILSGFADLNGLIGAINEAAIYRFLAKPWNDYELVSTLGQALAFHDLERENERLADLARVERGQMSVEELERKRLEEEEPGITKVNWGPDGSVILD